MATMTPWGFSVEDAFAALRERAATKRTVAALQDRSTSLSPTCRLRDCHEWPARADKFCPAHRAKLVAHRQARREVQREAAARQRELAARAQRAAHLPGFADEWERNAQRPVLRQARREYEASRPRRAYSGPPRRGYVYRLFDASGSLLYIGKTFNIRHRFYTGPQAHVETKDWWADVQYAEVTEYRSEQAALDAEALAIEREAPRYNRAHPVPRGRRMPNRVTAYCERVPEWSRELARTKSVPVTGEEKRRAALALDSAF